MKKPPLPSDETCRLEALRLLNILDTDSEERFDRLTRLARRLFSVPIALVSLVDEDRQWFKSRSGLDALETPRDISFCGHTILGDEIFVVEDTAGDDRFCDNPLVLEQPYIRFYAGCPLKSADGYKLGTLCLIDTQPRSLDADDLAVLEDLTGMAEQELAAVQMATMDELTGISNRRGFELLAKKAIDMCARNRTKAAIIFIDLDGFKMINDSLGHGEGDSALKTFAEALSETYRDSDIYARLGGDEFVVFVTSPVVDAIPRSLERLKRVIEEKHDSSIRGYEISFTAGFVDIDPRKKTTLATLLKQADSAMYSYKP